MQTLRLCFSVFGLLCLDVVIAYCFGLKTKKRFKKKDGSDIMIAARAKPSLSPHSALVIQVMNKRQSGENRVTSNMIKRLAATNFQNRPSVLNIQLRCIKKLTAISGM